MKEGFYDFILELGGLNQQIPFNLAYDAITYKLMFPTVKSWSSGNEQANEIISKLIIHKSENINALLKKQGSVLQNNINLILDLLKLSRDANYIPVTSFLLSLLYNFPEAIDQYLQTRSSVMRKEVFSFVNYIMD